MPLYIKALKNVKLLLSNIGNGSVFKTWKHVARHSHCYLLANQHTIIPPLRPTIFSVQIDYTDFMVLVDQMIVVQKKLLLKSWVMTALSFLIPLSYKLLPSLNVVTLCVLKNEHNRSKLRVKKRGKCSKHWEIFSPNMWSNWTICFVKRIQKINGL